MPGTDNPLVLDVINRYLDRLAIIQRTTQLLDDPGRVGVVAEIVDSPDQRDRLNQVCKALCTLFKVPISTVTVVDVVQSRVMGECGLNDTASVADNVHLENNAITRDRSLCTFVAASGHEFDMSTLGDSDLACLPAYVEMDIRAYLGVPVNIKGKTIGSLCLVDFVPRSWTETDKMLLANYASHVSSILEEES